MIVHSLDNRRKVVEKRLSIDDGKVYLEHAREKFLIEKDAEVWNALSGNELRNNTVNMVNVTNKCNLNCDYCYFKNIGSGWKDSEISLEQAKTAIDKIKDVPNDVRTMRSEYALLDDNTFPKIRISGGEPTVWEPLPDLLHYIVENKNNIYIAK